MVDFIGIGAARSGTTWIASVLREHPELCIAEPKEIRYFNRYVIPIGADRGRLNPDFCRPRQWYLQHFRHCGSNRLKGEYSPIYLYDEAAPSAIRRSFPDVKLLCCLRNPVDRAYSHYWLSRGSGAIREMSFAQALREESVYVEMGFYARQLGRYYRHFERRQMLVLLFEDIVREPAREIARILRFLGVQEHAGADPGHRSRNRSAGLRSKELRRALYRASRLLSAGGLSPVLRGLRKIGVHTLFNRLNSSAIRYPPMSAELRRRLNDVFAADTAALEALLEQDLSAWRYPAGLAEAAASPGAGAAGATVRG